MVFHTRTLGPPHRLSVFQTHLFRDFTLDILGCQYSQDSVRAMLSNVMEPPFFPVNLDDLKSTICVNGGCVDTNHNRYRDGGPDISQPSEQRHGIQAYRKRKIFRVPHRQRNRLQKRRRPRSSRTFMNPEGHTGSMLIFPQRQPFRTRCRIHARRILRWTHFLGT